MKDKLTGIIIGLAIAGLLSLMVIAIFNEVSYASRCRDLEGVPLGGRSPHVCYIEGVPIDVSRSDYIHQTTKIREKIDASVR